ncbi:hypothetical protein GQ457_01G055770 [Hibiscus cannabinus]
MREQVTSEILASSPAYQEQMKSSASSQKILVTQRVSNSMQPSTDARGFSMLLLPRISKSKTVKKVVYTRSMAAVYFNKENTEMMDESYWTDVDYVRSEVKSVVSSYAIAKTLTEKAVLEFATHHGLDLVSVVPPMNKIILLICYIAGSDVNEYKVRSTATKEMLVSSPACREHPKSSKSSLQISVNLRVSMQPLKDARESSTLPACLNSETVKKVVDTSSACAVMFNDKGVDMVDESFWTDVDFVRENLDPSLHSYVVSKTLIERAALEFGAECGDTDSYLRCWSFYLPQANTAHGNQLLYKYSNKEVLCSAMQEMEEDKGTVCVTGGTGFIASWLIRRLLQEGYSVRTTVRHDPENKRDLSFLTSLPGADEKLKIFSADLSDPDSFDAAIEGSKGVFHVASPVDFENKEPEKIVTERVVGGTLGILKACIKAKTVKRVVYTSSASAVVFNGQESDMMDESFWSDLGFVREKVTPNYVSYIISKTLTEKAALEFGAQHGLDVVTVIPSLVFGPFICPSLPASVPLVFPLVSGTG